MTTFLAILALCVITSVLFCVVYNCGAAFINTFSCGEGILRALWTFTLSIMLFVFSMIYTWETIKEAIYSLF